MSASLYYQPVKGTYLKTGASSGFIALLERVFDAQHGHVTLTLTDIGRLKTAAATTENAEYREALNILAEAVEKHGEVRVWPEY